jgi:hypothetical protein
MRQNLNQLKFKSKLKISKRHMKINFLPQRLAKSTCKKHPQEFKANLLSSILIDMFLSQSTENKFLRFN